MASNTHRLLDELEKLAYNGRIKRMYELGRVAANSAGNTKAAAEAKAVIAELWSGNFYQRQMALLSCHGSRDAQAVFNATSDNSELIRHYAISLASVMCSDEQVATIFVELHEKSQRFVLKALRRERRFALVDKLVAGLVNASTSKLLNAYFFASEDFVRKNFDLIEDRLAGEYMARFAYQHPKYAAAYLLQLAKASRTLDPRLVWLVNSALPRLAELIPDDALELVMEVIRTVPARQLSLSCMLRYRLDDTIGILHKRDALDSISFGSYLSKMSPESLSKVLQANALPRSRYSTLRRISSASASIIYSAVSEGWRDGSGCLPLELIDKLPESVRVLEAHKHLANPLVESRLAERFSYVKYLPWDEAVATLGELLNSQDVDNRALAFRSLIAVVRFHRQNRHELLELLIKRKNEPDPVRLETLAGIAALPPSIWQQENQEQINAIINNALSAPDLSDGSISYVAQFIVRALKFRTEWAQQWLGKLLKDRGSYILGRAGSHQLSESELRQLAPHLLPAVEHWHAREDSTHLVILAQWYGKKLRVFPQLIEALCSVTQKVKNESSAMRAAEALYSCARQDFGNLVPKLLKEDQSWGLTVPVYTFLHRIRQDLLTPYLGQNNLTGRLNRGKVRLVPNFNNGFYCWTTKQQNLYAEQLKLMAMDSKLAFHNRLFGLQRLVLLPEPPMDVLRKLAEIKSNEQQHVVTRDFVLGHLGGLDGGQGIPILLDALQDDRARVAIYAMKKVPRIMPAARAMQVLQQVPRKQITVSKEVIRLIGELKTDEAFLWLSRISAENLHKDEHVAVTRALWSYTDRDEAWDLLDGAIESGQPDRIDTALRVPPSGLSSKGRERLLKLCARALSVENVRTRLACITRMTLLPVMDVEGIVQPPLVRCINSTSPDEASAASRCLLKMYANHSGDLMSTVIRELANNTRSLVIFLSMVEGWMRQDRKFLVSAAEEIAEALSEQPRMISWQIRITAAASSWEKLGALLRSLDASNRLHADAMAAAAQAFTNISFRPDIEELESLEAELARQDSEQLRRLGLAALSALGLTSSGWTRSRLERLLEYRADDSMLVASAAALTLPANELQPAVAS